MLDLRPLSDPLHHLFNMPWINIGPISGGKDQILWIGLPTPLFVDLTPVEHMAYIIPKWNLEVFLAGFGCILDNKGSFFGAFGSNS